MIQSTYQNKGPESDKNPTPFSLLRSTSSESSTANLRNKIQESMPTVKSLNSIESPEPIKSAEPLVADDYNKIASSRRSNIKTEGFKDSEDQYYESKDKSIQADFPQ